ncbi:mitochondrial carrier domain-containing protein [Coemansia mojavensis]|nr:mitochondrial carrier domain-containing protein [Coemansia mojavensis]
MGADKKHGSLVHLGAGALSGVTSCVLLQPFDLIKTRLQQRTIATTVQNVVATDGIQGLWRGTLPSLLRNAPGTSLYFYFLNHTKHYCLAAEQKLTGDSTRTQLSASSNMVIGASSRALAGFLLMPGTILKVQFESSLYKYAGIAGAIRDIWRRSGARGFFVGAVPTAIRDAPYAGLYLLLYEAIKNQERAIAQRRNVLLPETTVTMVAGVAAGLAASYITQPFDMVKTRMQLRPHEYTSVAQSFRKIHVEETFRGFFRGISLRVLRKGVQASLVFTLYEWVLRSNALSGEAPSAKIKA